MLWRFQRALGAMRLEQRTPQPALLWHSWLIRHSAFGIRHGVTPTHFALLFFAIGLIAFLYSSVGHDGASGYIATMALFGIAATPATASALVLNILVATIGTFQFWRAGHFSWK